MKKKKMAPKKVFWLILICLLVIVTLFFINFIKNANKDEKFGNTMINQTKEQLIESILNMNSYEATIHVEITSNKNTNQYELKQKYHSSNKSYQEILSPSNIQGLKLTYDGNRLKLENTRLNLTTVFENYPYIAENYLWLSSFIEEYKKQEDAKCEEVAEEYRLCVDLKTQAKNKPRYKILYISKKTGKPTKLEVQDINQKTFVYILYNEIKMNRVKESDILAKIQN